MQMLASWSAKKMNKRREREGRERRVRAIDRTKESQRVSGQVHCADCSCLSRMKVKQREAERERQRETNELLIMQ